MKYPISSVRSAALALGLTFGLSSAQAVLVNAGAGSFTPAAAVITFSEFAQGTVNPSYSLAAGSLGTVGVTFAGSFVGQTITGGSVKTLTGLPTGPLTLGAGDTFITTDGANPTSPVLSGTPTFNGPISVLFSVPVAAVGLGGGFFDNINSTSITAFDANGAVLGTITNSQTGIEFYGLADSSGAAVIKGISFYITGAEAAGFAIDNLTFGGAEVIVGRVPDAGSTFLFFSAVLGAMVAFRRRMLA
jgi:hypothetical protein